MQLNYYITETSDRGQNTCCTGVIHKNRLNSEAYIVITFLQHKSSTISSFGDVITSVPGTYKILHMTGNKQIPLWPKSTVNAAAECDPTKRQGSSIWEAARRTLISMWQVSTCSLQSVGCELRLREGVFYVCRKSRITNSVLTWNFVSNCKNSAKETHEMLKLVCGDAAVTMKTVYKWFERFRNGCESVEHKERSGGPSTSKTQ